MMYKHNRPVEGVNRSVGNNTRRLREFHGKTCQMITPVLISQVSYS